MYKDEIIGLLLLSTPIWILIGCVVIAYLDRNGYNNGNMSM